MPTLTFLGAAAAATVLTFGTVAGAAAATGGDSTPSAGRPGQRLEQACDHIPVRLARVEKLQTRLHADARTRGSLAFLQARIDRATAEGHADKARLLNDRLAVRKDLDAALPDILTRLKDAQEVCASRPTGASS